VESATEWRLVSPINRIGRMKMIPITQVNTVSMAGPTFGFVDTFTRASGRDAAGALGAAVVVT